MSAGFAAMLLLVARPARAQDVTPLVVALVPPLLLAPPCLALARRVWLRRGSPLPGIGSLLAVSCLEVLLWVVLAASSVLFLTGDWHIRAFLGPVLAGAALWRISRIWVDPSRRAARWLFLVSPPLALGLLAAATWMALLTFT